MDKLPPFMPGMDLNRLFFQQVVKPLLDKHFPGLVYSVGLMGDGSDVLRYDTPLSMDHNWGPHLVLFLSDKDHKEKHDDIYQMLRHKLPHDFLGFPTNFTEPDENAYLVSTMKQKKSGPVNHMIKIHTVRSFFTHYLGIDPYKRLTTEDWLTFPHMALIHASQGELYYDGLNVQKVRDKFAYYPEKIWLWMYWIQWGKISDIMGFIGRSGQVGDEIGSSLITSDMVTKIMKLCFLMERTYFPYMKWFGTAFSRLKCAPELAPLLLEVVHTQNWQEREKRLGNLYEKIIELHNRLGITKPTQTKPHNFHGRPFIVFDVGDILDKLWELLDPKFKKFTYKLGSVDQFIDHPRLNHMEYVYRKLRGIIK